MPNVEQRAKVLLEDSSIRHAPVPVERIAEALGIELRYSPGKRDVSGALIRNGDTAVIAVNSAQHENRQRFTVAHEIGHYVLHKTLLHFDGDFSVTYRDSVSSKATDRAEIEANRFAAALLMPAAFIRKDLTKLIDRGATPETAIDTLSNKYKVSRRAMELRLVNLGYVSPVDE